jgi:hypothetical protein
MERPSNMINLLCNISGRSYWSFVFGMKKPDDILLFRNEEPRRHFIFRNEEARRYFIFRMKPDDILFFGMKKPDDILFFGGKKIIFRTCQAMAILFYGQKKPSNFYFSTILSSLDWKLQSALRRICFPSLHVVAYKWVLSNSFSCLS